MKIRRKKTFGLTILVLVALFSTVSFAEGWHHGTAVKALREAASLLQSSRPDLAATLTKFADQEDRETTKRYESRIKLLKDSAAALQSSNPDLADGLTQFAAHKEEMMRAKKEGKVDQAEEKKGSDMKAEFATHIKLLRDSATALQASNPELAKGLTQFANHKAKEMEKKE